jgi:hypothetical protein
VLAEGVWSESHADGPGLRGQFHNLAEFSALYPDYQAPDEIRLCAPRPVHGAVLERVILKAVTRAAHGRAVGFLRGYIDVITPADKIEGWTQDTSQPELPVLLEILSGGVVIGTALACHHRQDVMEAGIGDGNCHFLYLMRRRSSRTKSSCAVLDGAEIMKSDDYASLKNLHKIQPDIQHFRAMRQPAGRN